MRCSKESAQYRPIGRARSEASHRLPAVPATIDILKASPWQMTYGERSALEGILSQLKPKVSIEIGTAEGGSLRRVARHSGHVHSFDLVTPDSSVQELENVTFHTGDSHALVPELLAKLAGEGGAVDPRGNPRRADLRRRIGEIVH